MQLLKMMAYMYLLAWKDIHDTWLSEKWDSQQGNNNSKYLHSGYYKKGTCPCTLYAVTHFNLINIIPVCW